MQQQKNMKEFITCLLKENLIEAKAAKAIADSVYGNSYWTPQLLYIESIYFVSKREDSSAIETLTSLNTQFASIAFAEKAQTMIDVLKSSQRN